MVSKIITGKSLVGALNYNEKKVMQGKAELIWENGFPKDLHLLSFNDKLSRLKDLALKNRITKTNTVHISLNFAVGEKLDKDVMTQIACEYMKGIGFGDQPYLVYSHTDAGHPHVHIVSTNIKNTGERIPLHNLGKTKSEVIRKAIEREFALIPASTAQKHERLPIRKVEYGKVDTKRAITNVISHVMGNYKFTSLPEFNAVLSRFNVLADRGAKESRMYAKNGLFYWVLNDHGKKVGIPIKASSIYGNPTLKNLASIYERNEKLRKPFEQQLKNAIDRVLITKIRQAGFTKALEAKAIQVIFRQNEEGRLYGVTFVDHHTKAVFNGSDLGKGYTAAALRQKFEQTIISQANTSSLISVEDAAKQKFQAFKSNDELGGKTLLEDLFKPDFQETAFPEMQQNKRKKKRRLLTR